MVRCLLLLAEEALAGGLGLLALGTLGRLLRLPLLGDVVGVGRRLDAEEAVHPHLRLSVGLVRLLEIIDLALNALGIEAALVAKEGLELLRLAIFPLEFGRREDLKERRKRKKKEKEEEEVGMVLSEKELGKHTQKEGEGREEEEEEGRHANDSPRCLTSWSLKRRLAWT